MVTGGSWWSTRPGERRSPPTGSSCKTRGLEHLYAEVACSFLPDLDRAALELSLRRLLSGGVDELRRTYAIQTPAASAGVTCRSHRCRSGRPAASWPSMRTSRNWR
jgi:hypothetical protein